jgi:hypothetical protein
VVFSGFDKSFLVLVGIFGDEGKNINVLMAGPFVNVSGPALLFQSA